MNDLTLSKYVKLFELLPLESKVELLSILTESIREGLKKNKSIDKEALSNELFGAWSEMDDNIIDVIYSSRSTSDREINFD